ncbi:hypothetical protein H8356DRAFT_1739540 [Neocallimastix lanati (nom. inval.)]|nr:hypothetical protein H8356DRAFT_1739540 [Neocallimastix sp. JGI-2020a]
MDKEIEIEMEEVEMEDTGRVNGINTNINTDPNANTFDTDVNTNTNIYNNINNNNDNNFDNNNYNTNIGFVGSEGYNQYSNPYNNDLYSQPSIKRKAQKIAEQNKRASQEYLNMEPTAPPETVLTVDPQETPDSLMSNNNSTHDQPKEQDLPEESDAENPQKLNSKENDNTQALLNKDNEKKDKPNSTVDVKDEEDEKSMKPPRKYSVCCMCCPLWLCVSIIAVIIILIGVLLFIFWPKIPDVKITKITLSESNQPIKYQLPTIFNGNKGGIELDIDIHISVKNDNFYDLSISNLDTRVYIQADNVEKTKIGRGHVDNLKFGRNNTTEFKLPLTIGYISDDEMERHTDLLYLFKACATHRQISIQYEVDIGIAVLEKIYVPTYKGNELFTCPTGSISEGIVDTLFSGMNSNIIQYLSSIS